MALPKGNLGLNGLLGGGLTNQLGNQQAASNHMIDAQRYAMEQMRTAFALDSRLIQRDRDPEGRMRYEIETQIARHKAEVERRLMELEMARNPTFYTSGTSGKLTIRNDAEAMFISDDGIKPLSQHLKDENVSYYRTRSTRGFAR